MSKSQEVFNLINEIFETDINSYDTQKNINDLDNWDSMKHMQLIIGVEEKFNISLSGDEIASLVTLQDLIDKITQ